LFIKSVVEYSGDLYFDSSKPDGTFRKKMDNSRMSNTGFTPKTSLRLGIQKTYDWFIKKGKDDC